MVKWSTGWVVLVVCAACGADAASTEGMDIGGAGTGVTGVSAGTGATGAAAGSGGGAGRTSAAGRSAIAAPAGTGASGVAGTAGAAGKPPAAGAGGGGAGTGGSAGATSAGAGGAAGVPAQAGAGAAAPAAMGCKDGNPLDILRGFAPKDADLAKDYASYLSEELVSASCATEGTGAARTIKDTIFVPPGAVYDGKGEKLTADAAAMRCDTSEGEQAEHQRPYFVLAPGASLKNVTITYPGCEGVHMLGDNRLENIHWEDAGEDAASVRSYFPGGKITIANSEGHKAADKMFQFNAPCSVRIEHFKGSDMGKLVRQNGGTEFKLEVDLNTVDVSGVISAVVQSDSPQCFVRHHALKYQFTGSGDKSDRVFRDIPPANVMQY